ncbi:hypothetical protein Vadar_011971 [Vaccinium darrowii]|uniref:Uncharacterized protein n=1 Tax=Vaccinium darrowii TaxID=229202 RepID=A0ACB7YVW0_9ERIC|nr:hypothetical protein Vadar_011971 [Vaccinium darrowii]
MDIPSKLSLAPLDHGPIYAYSEQANWASQKNGHSTEPKEVVVPRLTAAAGTELAGASSSSPVMIAHSTKELYKWHCPSSLMRYCWIGPSPIVQDSPLLPPMGVRAVSQSQCG